jgi:hypothetical protein
VLFSFANTHNMHICMKKLNKLLLKTFDTTNDLKEVGPLRGQSWLYVITNFQIL